MSLSLMKQVTVMNNEKECKTGIGKLNHKRKNREISRKRQGCKERSAVKDQTHQRENN